MSDFELKYQLYGEAFKSNPFPIYAIMRQTEPVLQCPGLQGEGLSWFVVNYEHVETVLRDSKHFIKRWENTRTPEESAQLAPEPIMAQMLNNHMLNSDGAEHTRLRTLVNKAFSATIVNLQRDRVQILANQLLDQVEPRGAMDLIEEYAFPLPIIVICNLLGIPDQDRKQFRAWSNAFIAPPLNQEEWQQHVQLLQGFLDYMRVVFEKRRAQPREDLITALVQAEEHGERLSESELYSMAILLIVAGHETTVNLIGNGTLALLQHPEQLAKLRNHPELIENAVEEFLRYDGPVDRATLRFAAEDIELGGKLIRRGEAINVVLSSANRDAAQYINGDTLDIERQNNRHVGFGLGVHYCVGAPLARMEGQIAINTLIQRLPNLRLAVPKEELLWGTVPIIRGLRHMPVVWER